MEQPRNTASLKQAANRGSSASLSASQRRLAALGFDPMQQLVDTYKALQAEIAYQESLRDGSIVELKANGEPKAFYPDNLYSLYDKVTNIADKLLRYGYGRVSETTILASDVKAPLVIKLRGGKEKVVNGDSPGDT